MARIIAVANQKGGVGKTTTVANLAAGLVKLGKSVVVVDLDSQGALSVSFGFDPYSIKPSTFDVLLDNDLTLDKIFRSTSEEIIIAPANGELVAAEYKILKEPDRVVRIKNSIQASANSLDFIIIDTPPNLGLLTINALVAAKELLIPVSTDYLSMRGVRALLESVWLIRERVNPKLRLLALVPTLFNPNSKHSTAVVSEIRRVFKHKVSETLIPQDEAASAAPAARKSAVRYRPNSLVSHAYLHLAEEVLNGR